MMITIFKVLSPRHCRAVSLQDRPLAFWYTLAIVACFLRHPMQWWGVGNQVDGRCGGSWEERGERKNACCNGVVESPDGRSLDEQGSIFHRNNCILISRRLLINAPWCQHWQCCYDTIRYGRLTCAQKLTRWPALSLIFKEIGFYQAI